MELIKIPKELTDEKAFLFCKENNINPQDVQGYPYIFGKFIQ